MLTFTFLWLIAWFAAAACAGILAGIGIVIACTFHKGQRRRAMSMVSLSVAATAAIIVVLLRLGDFDANPWFWRPTILGPLVLGCASVIGLTVALVILIQDKRHRP